MVARHLASVLSGALLFSSPPLAFFGPAPVLAGPGLLRLKNERFDQVMVEIRVGASDRCDQHPGGRVHTLGRGQGWSVVGEKGTVCWRREAQPGGPNTEWTAWDKRALTPDTVHEVSL